jgi:2-keto-4-pentenoate hydratase/2-oxohepta-3-ene-1,7-dioic acid hydratase in catechol pathway
MRIVVFGPHRRVGAWEGDAIVDVNLACAKYEAEQRNEPQPYELANALTPAGLRDFIEGGQRALDSAREAVAYVTAQAGGSAAPRGEQIVWNPERVKLHAPIANPGQPIAAMGANYVAHTSAMRQRAGDTRSPEEALREARSGGLISGGEVTKGKRPVGAFWKLTDTIAGHDEDIMYPARTQKFDYEGEVAVVIGRRAKHVPASRAHEYIWGVTTHVDWSIRDGDDTGNRTFRHAKNFDTCSSMGPSIVVGELDPQNVDMQTRVNGELRQDYNSRDMTFNFAEIIEYLSDKFPLVPGFVISGGCGPGTAMEMNTPEAWLQPGHVVEFWNPSIGLLRHRIVAET